LIFSDVFTSAVWEGVKGVRDPELQRLAAKLPGIAMCSKQDNTVKQYSYGFQRWKTWASKFVEVVVLPAEPRFVSLYLVHVLESSKTCAPVINAFYSISWAHKLACSADPTDHDVVKRVKEAAMRLLGKGSNKKDPLTAEHIHSIVARFESECSTLSLKDLRVLCMIILGFTGFLRFDELSSIKSCDIIFAEHFVKIFIEKSKTDVHRIGSWVFIAKINSVCCPVKMLAKYIVMANLHLSEDIFIFRALTYLKNSNSHVLRKANVHISYSSTREIMLAAFSKIGLTAKAFGTHSLRKRGGEATMACKNKVSDRLFKKHGRWLSDKSKDSYVTEDLDERLSVSKNLGL
jgi:hypothetical protein